MTLISLDRTVGAGSLLPAAARAGGSADAVGRRAGARELAAVDDQVLLSDWSSGEGVLEDLAGSCCVTGLGGERGARGMGGHGVVGHGPPRVVRRWRPGVPDVAGVAGQLAGVEGSDDGVA